MIANGKYCGWHFLKENGSFMRRMRMLSECCRRKEHDICRRLSLSSAQLACLMSFPEKEDAGVVRVSERLELSPFRVSRIVGSLVRRGLVARERSTSDRRREKLDLTQKGRGVRRSIDFALDVCDKRLRRTLGAAHARELEHALDRLLEALQGL
jgi:DNA-binding MarR family transcriptional regulator